MVIEGMSYYRSDFAKKRLYEDIYFLFFCSFHHIEPNIVEFGFEDELVVY